MCSHSGGFKSRRQSLRCARLRWLYSIQSKAYTTKYTIHPPLMLRVNTVLESHSVPGTRGCWFRPCLLKRLKIYWYSSILKLHAGFYFFFSFLFFFNLTYSRWNSSLPSCLWSLMIFPSLPGSRLTIIYRDASSALLQLVNQWLNFTYSRSHASRYERKNTNPTLVRIELTTSALAGVQVTY